MEDRELKRYLKKIAESNRWHNVILRATINGFFIAFWTTIGLSMVVVAGTYIFVGIKDLPLIDKLLSTTKIDALIEAQLHEINNKTSTNGDGVVTEATMMDFSSNYYGLKFQYPSNLTSVLEYSLGNNSGKAEYLTLFEGTNGVLKNIALYVNTDELIINGESNEQKTKMKNDEEVIFNVFEEGATINSINEEVPTFHLHFEKDGNKYDLIAKGDTSLPKLSREGFIKIIETLE
jgi:hypothetical protein